ncbi:MAG: STAS domain-containing protein [Verrucomicrobia bacterium]|nr:STAS domain-containing protein [Verrucomicrobiota bacterium]
MSREPPEILVCTDGPDVCIRIRGRADVTISVGFKELINRLRQHHFTHYELELSECRIMDSTFLGVICGFAQKLESGASGKAERPILFNANERITGLLTSLGVEGMFDFRRGSPGNRGPCEPQPLPAGQADRESLNATSLEAHRTLMALNPDNIPKFKDLTEFLASDLKKIRGNL